MIIFFRNIRQQLLNENKTGKYLMYAIGEIVLVVMGILIALSINNWNSKRIEKREEISSYKNIKRQINDDKNVISGIIDYNNLYYKQYKYANQVIDKMTKVKSIHLEK
jgi:hypothetical protein